MIIFIRQECSSYYRQLSFSMCQTLPPPHTKWKGVWVGLHIVIYYVNRAGEYQLSVDINRNLGNQKMHSPLDI